MKLSVEFLLSSAHTSICGFKKYPQNVLSGYLFFMPFEFSCLTLHKMYKQGKTPKSSLSLPCLTQTMQLLQGKESKRIITYIHKCQTCGGLHKKGQQFVQTRNSRILCISHPLTPHSSEPGTKEKGEEYRHFVII